MNKMKALLISMLGAAAVVQAHAEDNPLVFANPSGATTTLYGQLNFAYQGIDDGTDSYSDVVNNTNSPSRIGLWVDVPLSASRFRFNFETALGYKSTAETSQILEPAHFNWQRTDIRKFEGIYSGDFGTLYLGQGSMASDGIAEFDLSGTSVAGYSALSDTAGAYLFRVGDMLSTVPIGEVFRNFDGGRRMRVRYDTPDFSGFTFSLAAGQDALIEQDDANYYDAALRYGLETDAIDFGAGFGYTWRDPQVGERGENLFGSGSLLHKGTGLNLTLAAGQDQTGNASYVYAKAGWLGRLIDAGPTAISVDYYDGSDFDIFEGSGFVSTNSDSEAWGVQALQHIEDLHLELYLGYRVYAFNRTTFDYQDVDTLLAGARWKF